MTLNTALWRAFFFLFKVIDVLLTCSCGCKSRAYFFVILSAATAMSSCHFGIWEPCWTLITTLPLGLIFFFCFWSLLHSCNCLIQKTGHCSGLVAPFSLHLMVHMEKLVLSFPNHVLLMSFLSEETYCLLDEASSWALSWSDNLSSCRACTNRIGLAF